MRGLPFALLSVLRADMCRKMAAISVMGERRSCKTVWVQLQGVRPGLRLSSSQMLGLAWSHCTGSEPQRDGLRAVSCFAVISLWLYHYRLAWLCDHRVCPIRNMPEGGDRRKYIICEKKSDPR